MVAVKRSALVLLVSALLTASSGAAIAFERGYVIWSEFQKSGADEYYGVRADWIDNDWSGIPCPDVDHNGVGTFVNAWDEAIVGWLQIGYVEWEDRPSAAGCIHHKDYYWERYTYEAGYDIDYFMVSEAVVGPRSWIHPL